MLGKRLNPYRSPKQSTKELRDRHCGSQHDQPVPDSPALVRIRRDRPLGPPKVVDAIAGLHVSRLPAIDVSLVPSSGEATTHLLMLRSPRWLSRRSSRSNPEELPRRLSKILRATSEGTDERIARRIARTIPPSAPTTPWLRARPAAARRWADPAPVPPAVPALPAPHENLQHSNPRGMSEFTKNCALNTCARWLRPFRRASPF